ncbi:hypothetical protein [Paraburkholderia sp. D1E]|uniref:hypothetical protein n=1 Tax=Paraburkholderia sp. D1E TaxID=3461398 RepID=UPI004045BA2C
MATVMSKYKAAKIRQVERCARQPEPVCQAVNVTGIWRPGVMMRTSTSLERHPHSGIASWCCVCLLVAALAVIVVDLTAIFQSISANTDMVDQNVPIQETLSRTPELESSKGALWSASDSALSIPDSEDFGIRSALNAELMRDSADQPALDGWPLAEPEVRSGDADWASCSRRAC